MESIALPRILSRAFQLKRSQNKQSTLYCPSIKKTAERTFKESTLRKTFYISSINKNKTGSGSAFILFIS